MTTRNWSLPFEKVARGIAGLNILMLLVGLPLIISFNTPALNNPTWLSVLGSLNAIVYSFIAVLILSRHPRHVVGWLLLVAGFFLALGNLNIGIAALALHLPIRSQLVRALLTMVGHFVWVPWLMMPISLLLQFFPNGRLLSRRWWPITALVILAMLGMEVSQVFIPWDENWSGPLEAFNVWSIPGSTAFFEQLIELSFILFGLGVAGTWIAVGVRFYRSREIERMQMKWLIYAGGITILSSQLNDVSLNNPYWPHIVPIFLPLGIGIAILRHRLFDIDIIIQRTLVYGILTTLIVGIYIGVVNGLGALFHTQPNTTGGLIATAVIAVLFQPVRHLLQRAANRLLFGQRDDPTAVLAQLAQQMETADSPADILPNLVHTIAYTLKIPHVAIWLPTSENQFEPVATWGESPEHVEMIALTFQNGMIGRLVVAPRSVNETFNHNEKQLLHTIAALTANTVRAVQLSNELGRSRQRIVTAREDERRRLRRDLHDGLGPQLASQTLGLDAVEQLLPTNPEKAHQLLVSLKRQAQEAISDVRRLVYALRPPALDDLGLLGALQQNATRYERGDLRFTLDVPKPLPALPAAVETAVYRITQEAMTNIVHHAQATVGTIRLACADHHLVVEICDNGQGLSPEHRSGVGLQSMRERAAELNGQFMIESRPEGGTKVRARLPLEVTDE